jgi:hypothetical protein
MAVAEEAVFDGPTALMRRRKAKGKKQKAKLLATTFGRNGGLLC